MNENNSINKQNQPNRCSQIFYNVAGIEKSERGKHEEAIEYFTRAINSNPEDAISYFNRATLKVRIGDMKGARSDFRKSEHCHRDSEVAITDYPLL